MLHMDWNPHIHVKWAHLESDPLNKHKGSSKDEILTTLRNKYNQTSSKRKRFVIKQDIKKIQDTAERYFWQTPNKKKIFIPSIIWDQSIDHLKTSPYQYALTRAF